MARRVHSGFSATITSGAVLAVLRDTPAGNSVSFPAQGEAIPGPAADEKLYVIGINPGTAPIATTIGTTATEAPIPPAPPVATTMHMHGQYPFGEIDGAQWEADGSTMTLDSVAPAAGDPKSMNFFSPGLNDQCTGLPLAFPTFVGDLNGTIVGDAKLTLHFASAPGTIKARLWTDQPVFQCNAAYVPPASEVNVVIPAGQNRVEVTFPNLNVNAGQSIMIEVLALGGTKFAGQVGRLLYDSPAADSKIEFQCVPSTGETDCLP
jgi:hypothetical protein